MYDEGISFSMDVLDALTWWLADCLRIPGFPEVDTAMKRIDHISRGGFGVVDKIELDDGRVVARKTFTPPGHMSLEERTKLRQRFNREVRFQESINSDAICPVLASDLQSADPWYLMPLADRTLEDEIKQAKSSGGDARQGLADVLNALEELHKLGFVHRDLKPQNVLFIDGVWKLADFGLVLPPSGATTELTSVGSAWGSQLYAAPEQLLDFHSVGPAADIYAFGCILHDLFGDQPRVPFARHTTIGPMGALIERCTETAPDRRFSSIAGLRAALYSVLSAQAPTTVRTDAADWLPIVKGDENATSERLSALVRYLRVEATSDARREVFAALNEEGMAGIWARNEDDFKRVMLDYAGWVSASMFAFDFCDLLAQRIETAFDIADIELKAGLILAVIRMACSHNRWYAMRKAIGLCGHSMGDQLARRVAIDLRALNAVPELRLCVTASGSREDALHELVRECLSPPNGDS